MNNLTISPNGIALIKGFEGLKLFAYQDKAGVWTIGYGSTRYKSGAPVKKGDMLVNEACAADLLLMTLKGFENTVNSVVKVPLNQNQFDALTSFQYNTGHLPGSTLLLKLNAGDYAGAAAQFAVWNKITVNGVHEVCDDLTKRRAKEARLFLTPIK